MGDWNAANAAAAATPTNPHARPGSPPAMKTLTGTARIGRSGANAPATDTAQLRTNNATAIRKYDIIPVTRAGYPAAPSRTFA